MIEHVKDTKPFCREEYRLEWIRVCLSLNNHPDKIANIKIGCENKNYQYNIEHFEQ